MKVLHHCALKKLHLYFVNDLLEKSGTAAKITKNGWLISRLMIISYVIDPVGPLLWVWTLEKISSELKCANFYGSTGLHFCNWHSVFLCPSFFVIYDIVSGSIMKMKVQEQNSVSVNV